MRCFTAWPVRLPDLMRSRGPIALLAVAAFAVAGCGSSESHAGGGGGQSVQGLILPKETSDLNVKPVIPKPRGGPPGNLQVRDVVQGNGATAESGDKLVVKYTGVSWSTGKQFDSNWDPGRKPFPFRLGAGMVIPGWDQGLINMRVGGRRELVIPPSLAYGAQGQPPVIAPNETLVFVIDLKKVTKAK
jgi:peptidylprolyl isomerase